MRKFTSLMLMLLCAVATWAQVSALTDLSNDKVYTFKSGRSSDSQAHYLLYHADAPNNLSSTYSGQGHTMDYSDETTNFQFAVYKSGDAYYMFNIAAQKFVGNNSNNNGAIPLVDFPTNTIEFRSSKNATYNFVISTNGAGALNCADTNGCHGVVNWNGGYNNLTDTGNIYLISEVGTLSAELKALIEERINVANIVEPARAIVNNASDTRVGTYKTTAVADVSAALAAFDAEQSSANLQALKEAVEALTDADKVTLAAHELFTLKCYEANRGYMVYSTVEGKGSETQVYLAGTNNTAAHAAADAEGVYKEWATVVVDGKTYIYNAENKKSITTDYVVQFTTTAPAAIKIVDINNGLNEVQFEADNRYLSFSPGWGADCVRRESGIDGGCMFYIDKTGETAPIETIAAVESAFLNVWKEQTKATLDYVGGYSSSLVDAIDAVSTFDGKNAFVQNNAKVAFAPGYYYIQHTGTKKYATFNGTNFVAASVATPTLDNIMQFVEEEGVTKLKVANAGKYVTLADAPAVSQVASDFAGGNAFTIEIKENAECTVKGGDQVMRTENNGDINYWWGDTNTKWHLIPVSEVSVTVNEFASICLPFAVETTGDVKAYAVEGTNNTHALLAERTDIPANQGAILKGNGTFTLNIIDAATTDWTANKLVGTTTTTTIDAVAGTTYYILAKPVGEEVGLYPDVLDGGTFQNNANKAYLPVTSGNAAAGYSFVFDWAGTTGVEGVVAEGAQDGAIYDITGRRVKAITAPGIYIVNGRKVVK